MSKKLHDIPCAWRPLFATDTGEGVYQDLSGHYQLVERTVREVNTSGVLAWLAENAEVTKSGLASTRRQFYRMAAKARVRA